MRRRIPHAPRMQGWLLNDCVSPTVSVRLGRTSPSDLRKRLPLPDQAPFRKSLPGSGRTRSTTCRPNPDWTSTIGAETTQRTAHSLQAACGSLSVAARTQLSRPCRDGGKALGFTDERSIPSGSSSAGDLWRRGSRAAGNSRDDTKTCRLYDTCSSQIVIVFPRLPETSRMNPVNCTFRLESPAPCGIGSSLLDRFLACMKPASTIGALLAGAPFLLLQECMCQLNPTCQGSFPAPIFFEPGVRRRRKTKRICNRHLYGVAFGLPGNTIADHTDKADGMPRCECRTRSLPRTERGFL